MIYSIGYLIHGFRERGPLEILGLFLCAWEQRMVLRYEKLEWRLKRDRKKGGVWLGFEIFFVDSMGLILQSMKEWI